MKIRKITPAAHSLLLLCYLLSMASMAQGRELNGFVLDESGDAIEGALVIASGVSFNGWATSGKDGSFHVKKAGVFVSIRHKSYKPRLIAAAELRDPILIQLT